MDELNKLRDLTRTLTTNGYLKDQTDSWKYAFDSVKEFICIVNPSCKIKFVNKPFLAFLDIPQKELINKKLSDLYNNQIITKECEIIEPAINEPHIFDSFYIQAINKWFNMTKSTIKDDRDVTIGYMFIIEDITKIRQADTKIQDMSYLLAESQRMALIGSWSLLAPNNVWKEGACPGKLIWSDEMYKIFEVEEDTSINLWSMFVTSVYHEDRDKISDAYINSLDNKTPYITTYRLAMPDGRLKYVVGWCETEYTVEGCPIKSVGTVQDITKSVLIQQEIDETSALIKGILDAIPDVIGVQDAHSNILAYNKAGLAMFGEDQSTVVKRRCYELIGRTAPCDDCQTAKCKISKKPEKLERYIERLEGWYDCRSYPILNEEGQVVKVIEHLRDITDLKNEKLNREVYYNKMVSAYNRINFLTEAMDGYIWDKERGANEEFEYAFIDSSFCTDFYGIKTTSGPTCKEVVGKTTSELLQSFKKNGREHGFKDISIITDQHCIDQGCPCDYIEAGYIEHKKGNSKWFILRVRKTPIFNEFGECTNVLGFANNCTESADSILNLIKRGLVTGNVQLLKGSSDTAKIYWVLEPEVANKLTHIDFP